MTEGFRWSVSVFAVVILGAVILWLPTPHRDQDVGGGEAGDDPARLMEQYDRSFRLVVEPASTAHDAERQMQALRLNDRLNASLGNQVGLESMRALLGVQREYLLWLVEFGDLVGAGSAESVAAPHEYNPGEVEALGRVEDGLLPVVAKALRVGEGQGRTGFGGYMEWSATADLLRSELRQVSLLRASSIDGGQPHASWFSGPAWRGGDTSALEEVLEGLPRREVDGLAARSTAALQVLGEAGDVDRVGLWLREARAGGAWNRSVEVLVDGIEMFLCAEAQTMAGPKAYCPVPARGDLLVRVDERLSHSRTALWTAPSEDGVELFLRNGGATDLPSVEVWLKIPNDSVDPHVFEVAAVSAGDIRRVGAVGLETSGPTLVEVRTGDGTLIQAVEGFLVPGVGLLR